MNMLKKYPLFPMVLPSCAFYSATLPLPPGINKSYQRVSYVKNGKEIRALAATAELKQFKKDAALIATQGFHEWELIDAVRSANPRTPLTVSIIFYYETMWKQDVDGGIKAVQDVVFKHLGLNDNLVKRLIVEKDVDREAPRADIEISFSVK